MKNKYFEIGPWSEKKLTYVDKYLRAYVKILHKQKWAKTIYIDLFAGPGVCQSKKDGHLIDGSPAIAFKLSPGFSKYILCDIDNDCINRLKKLAKKYKKESLVTIKKRNANTYVNEVAKLLESNISAFVFLDPQALELNYKTIESFFDKKRVDFLINFQRMALNRTIGNPKCKEIVNKLFGNEDWQQIVRLYKEGKISYVNFKNKILKLYVKPLEKNGFCWTVTHIYNSLGAPLYDLIFASRNLTAIKIMKDVTHEDNPQLSLWSTADELVEKIFKEYRRKKTITLKQILEDMISGDNNYRMRDFQNALKILEGAGNLKRLEPKSKRVKRFDSNEQFRLC